MSKVLAIKALSSVSKACRQVLAALVALGLMLGSAAAAGATGATTVINGPLPAPDTVARSLDHGDGRQVEPMDTLQIEVFNVDSLSRSVQVDASGRFDFPLIGGVTATGKTPPQLAEHISARLGEKYLQSPRVTVFVKDAATRKYTVEGAVREPGVFDWSGPTTLMQVIARAKGAEGSASLRDIMVFRMVNKQKVAGVFNLDQIRRGKVEDPAIYSDDLVVVADSRSQRILRQILSTSPLFFFIPH